MIVIATGILHQQLLKHFFSHFNIEDSNVIIQDVFAIPSHESIDLYIVELETYVNTGGMNLVKFINKMEEIRQTTNAKIFLLQDQYLQESSVRSRYMNLQDDMFLKPLNLRDFKRALMENRILDLN